MDWESLLEQPQLWKAAMWGTPRDATLIERLEHYPTMQEQLEQLNWGEPPEGFQVGKSQNKDREAKRKPTPEFLKEIPFLPTKAFTPFYITTEGLTPTKENRLYNPGNVERFQAPLVLIHQSKCQAAYVNAVRSSLY